MKRLLLLTSCLCLLSCEEDVEPKYKKGDILKVKNTEITVTVIYDAYFGNIDFYYEDDFGTLHKESLQEEFFEKAIDNP